MKGFRGSKCTFDNHCQSGYICFDGVCALESGFSSVKDKDECINDSYCRSYQYCSSKGWKCQDKKFLGEKCDFDNECRDSYECKLWKCAFKSSSSSSSFDRRECIYDHECKKEYFCSSKDWKCHRKGDEGDKCVFDSHCKKGLECSLDGRCESKEKLKRESSSPKQSPVQQAKEEKCYNDQMCPIRFYCSLATGKCEPKLGSFATCTSDNQCESPLVCLNNQCRSKYSETTKEVAAGLTQLMLFVIFGVLIIIITIGTLIFYLIWSRCKKTKNNVVPPLPPNFPNIPPPSYALASQQTISKSSIYYAPSLSEKDTASPPPYSEN